MKMSHRRGLFAGVVLVSLTGFAHAGGLAEPVEPYVAVPGDGHKRAVPVYRAPPKRSLPCRWVTVAVTNEPPLYFANQGFSVSGCCCGSITIPGNSFSLGGQSSVRQELVCGGEGNS